MPEPISMICVACGTLFAGISATGTIFSGTERIVKKLGSRFGNRGHKHQCPKCKTGATVVDAYAPHGPHAGHGMQQQNFYSQQNYYIQQNFYSQAPSYGQPAQQSPLPPRPQLIENLVVYCPICSGPMSVKEVRGHVANCNNVPGQPNLIQAPGNPGSYGGGSHNKMYPGYDPAQIAYPGYSGQQGYTNSWSPPPYYQT